VALVAVGCAGVGSSGAAGPRAGGTSPSSTSLSTSVAKTATPANVVRSRARPIWLRSLQMTSPTTGWALYYSGDPNSSSAVFMLLARTTDGGRTWTDVTPMAARRLLAAPDAEHGFVLLGGDDGAMGQDSVWLYRTSDGGAHWSRGAATPAPTGATVGSQPGPGQIPAACDKNGVAFPTATAGWIASTCNPGLANALLVSEDGGTRWSDQSLPLPATTCARTTCTVGGPQFVDGIGFVTVEPQPDGPALLVTRDLGQTWERLALPAGLQYPQITFFSPTQAVLVAGETQGAFGGTFYTTADGGQTWTPMPQGINLTRLGVDIDFANRRDGFAWTNGLEIDPVPPTSIYETANSGRSWHAFTPKLAA
jgi:photosystem II stability/assembly factor-like uncharacterized protein